MWSSIPTYIKNRLVFFFRNKQIVKYTYLITFSHQAQTHYLTQKKTIIKKGRYKLKFSKKNY